MPLEILRLARLRELYTMTSVEALIKATGDAIFLAELAELKQGRDEEIAAAAAEGKDIGREDTLRQQRSHGGFNSGRGKTEKMKNSPQFKEAERIGVEIMRGRKIPLTAYALAGKILEDWPKKIEQPDKRKLQRWIAAMDLPNRRQIWSRP